VFRIALIDYKAGNLTSVRKALAAVGAEVYTPEVPDDLAEAQGIIVPGVGHFAATAALDAAWRDMILARVGEGRPLLGICLGLQWLFEGSEESPDLKGLGVLGGTCVKLRGSRGETAVPPAHPQPDVTADIIKVPHVGWNSLERLRNAPILDGVANGAQVYFTHSYVAPITADTVAATTHGERFASVVQRGQIAGVQFHPEKSGDVGLQVLRNFLRMVD
jgi:glutamine amidotransferase